MTSGSVAGERNESLLAWYAANGRDLPWRKTQDPYPILVAEVMSQQTQISRVLPHWGMFMVAFPSVDALAAAPLRDVLRAWSGLGYNARAKRLHQAAKAIVARGWPPDVSGLEELPGVGRYTASAVAAFAYGAPVAAIDTNLRRVLSRWHGETLDGSALERAAEADLDLDAGAWNQAVMDLAAAICTPRSPSCSSCPVDAWCAGPDTYVPPRAQPRFEGSRRHVRGSIVRRLAIASHAFEGLVEATGFTADLVEEVLEDLIAEGLVEECEDGTLQLPG